MIFITGFKCIFQRFSLLNIFSQSFLHFLSDPLDLPNIPIPLPKTLLPYFKNLILKLLLNGKFHLLQIESLLLYFGVHSRLELLDYLLGFG
jgi:hypothetical protein